MSLSFFRAAIVLGYCPVELHGLSAYELIHHADIPFALNAHFTGKFDVSTEFLLLDLG